MHGSIEFLPFGGMSLGTFSVRWCVPWWYLDGRSHQWICSPR